MEKTSSRLSVLAIIYMAIGVSIAFQMFRIQVFEESAALLEDGKLYALTEKTLIPPRGQIFDRSGNLLAGNELVYEVGLELKDIKDPEGIAFVLMYYFDLDYGEAFEEANRQASANSVYRRLLMNVPAEKVDQFNLLEQQLRDLRQNSTPEEFAAMDLPVKNLGGLEIKPYLRRTYPEGDLASNVLGFVNMDGDGVFGVEQYYQQWLSSKPVQVWISRDPYLASQIPEMPAGIDLVLTLDREIQVMVENTLDEAIQKNGAESGTIIVLEPKTGAILAMASSNRIDPNRYSNYAEFIKGNTGFNSAISRVYEPGSVMKIVPMAAALDQDLVEPVTEYVDTGYIEVGGMPILNWDRGAWGPQSMIGCLKNSLNVCLAMLSVKLGPANFYDYMERFGFGEKTNIDLAGEEAGEMRTPGHALWSESDMAANSFGQALMTTPLQMAMAASALANNGKMMTPHVAAAMIENGVQKNLAPQVAGYPIIPGTAAEISEMLAISMEDEASTARVEGYRLAGKTGTGQIATPGQGYRETRTNTSFVGWGPVDDPQFLVYVWFERPTSSIWGSEVAAPVFKQVVERLVVLLDIPPDEVRKALESP